MLGKSNADLYAAALATPPCTPQHAIRKDFGQFKLLVPPDEAALHDLIKQAHKKVTAAIARRGRGGDGAYLEGMKREVGNLLMCQPIYWSKVWPAGLMLGRYLMTEGRNLCGPSKLVLELGAGIGVGAVCAALCGAASVVCTDIEPKGLEFAMQSARDNNVANGFRIATWDWNEPPPAAVATLLGGASSSSSSSAGFDCVLVGDCIYQDEHAPALGRVLSAVVKPRGGCVVFSDSLERPYKLEHQSVLCDMLLASGFRRRVCKDLEMNDLDAGGVAAGRSVRMLVYERA